MTTARVQAARSLLESLYSGAERGYAALFWIDPKDKENKGSTFFDATDPAALERMADEAVRLSDTLTVYYNVNLMGAPLPGKQRGTEDDVVCVVAAKADCDIKPGDPTKPQSAEEVRDFLASLPLQPSIIVSSGRGLHPYWPFHEPYTIESPAERRELAAVLKGWERFVHQRAAERGWRFDSVADLPRVLRLPGTLNHKYDPPLPVELKRNRDDRFSLSDFEDYIPDGFVGEPMDAPAEGGLGLTDRQVNAIVTILAPHTRDGNRHHISHAAAAWLANNEFGEAAALKVVGKLSAAAGDSDTDAKLKNCRDTYAKLRAGTRPLGASWIRQELGGDVLSQLDKVIRPVLTAHAEQQEVAAVIETIVHPSPDRFNQTDLGNAERLAHDHRNDLRYCHQWSKWLHWDGARFAVDDVGRVIELAKQSVRSIYHEAANTEDDQARTALVKHARSSEKWQRIQAMIQKAQSEPGIPVRPDDLDRDPWLLACKNGTIDLRTGKLLESNRAHLITKVAPVAYDPAADCPVFLEFLDQIMNGDAELIDFLQRAIGYSLTGTTVERVVFILWGTGKNGKSTLLELLRTIFGDYAMRTPTETLMVRRGSEIPNDIARLKGVRFVSASESEEGQRLAEARIKDITGGDMISARFMRGEFFDFLPSFKLWLATNHKPVIRGTDNAIWDRIKLIPFRVRIPDSKQDKHLREKLAAEAPGILAWAVQGCLAWQRDGLGDPVKVREATKGYRAEMDVLGSFIEECCVVAEHCRATAAQLYAAYSRWCEDAGERSITKTAMGKQLTERGFDSAQVGATRARTWFGIGLRVIPTDAPPGERVSQDRTRLNADSEISDSYPDSYRETRETRSNAFTPTNAFTSNGAGHVDVPQVVPF